MPVREAREGVSMAVGRLFKISKNEIGRYELPRRPRMRRIRKTRRNGMGVTAIMGISNGRGAWARHLRKNRVKTKGKKGKGRVVGGLKLYGTAPAKHRRSGATRPGQYAYPQGYRYPVHDKAHVYRALRYYARYRDRYSPEVRRTIEQGIAKAAKRFGVDSPYASQLRRKFNINPEGDNMLFTRRRRKAKRNAKTAKRKPVRRMRVVSTRRYKKGKGKSKSRTHVGYAKYVVGGRRVALSLTSRGNIRSRISANKRRKPARKSARMPRPVVGIRRIAGRRVGMIYGARTIKAKTYKDSRRGGKRYISALVTNRRRRRLRRNENLGFAPEYADFLYPETKSATKRKKPEGFKLVWDPESEEMVRVPIWAHRMKEATVAKKRGKKAKGKARRKGKLTKAQRAVISRRNLKHARLKLAAKRRGKGKRSRKGTKRSAPRKTVKRTVRRKSTRKSARRKATPNRRRSHARRRFHFTMNPRRKHARRVFGNRRRRHTRRNATLGALKSMLPQIGTVFGGFVLHKFLTGLLASLIGKYTKGSKSISAVAVALAGHMFGDKVISKTRAEELSLGMFASLGHTLVVDLLPSISPRLGLGTSQSLLPRYAVGDYYEAASGNPFVQAAAGQFTQAAAGVGEYFSDSGSIAQVRGGAAGEYFVSDITLQGSGDYEVLPQAASGMGAVYDGVRPDGNLEQQFQMMEAAAGVGAYAGRASPSQASIYIPQENALAVGRGSSQNAGIFDQGMGNGVLS